MSEPKMFEQEPEPLNEGTPEVEGEIWATMKAMGAKPDDVMDPEEREGYSQWLAEHGDDQD